MRTRRRGGNFLCTAANQTSCTPTLPEKVLLARPDRQVQQAGKVFKAIPEPERPDRQVQQAGKVSKAIPELEQRDRQVRQASKAFKAIPESEQWDRPAR